MWTTPRLLVALGALVVVLAAALGTVVAASASAVDSGIDVIGGQTAPQVRVSADLYFALSDLDAQAANALLVGTGPALAADRAGALRLYEQRRRQVDDDLDEAAADAGADPTAQRMISGAIDQVGQYQALVAQALLINEQGRDPVGRPSAGALATYRQATDLMRSTLANVQRLTAHNGAVLDSTYTDTSSGALAVRPWLGLIGIAVVAALVGLQFVLRVRLRRRTNPALLVGTAAALVLTGLGIGLLSSEANQLRIAKSEAFDSIIALSQARSVAYDANADESRYLVDPGRAAQYQQAFLTKTQSLLNLGSVGLFRYDTTLATALNAYHADNADIPFTGYFGTELRNITFPGERAAADRMLVTFQTYQRDDRHLRALAAAGNLTGAVAFDIGTAPGESDHDFTAFDTALTHVIQINQNGFTQAITNGRADLSGWTAPIPGVGTLLITVALLVGSWPRIAEYR